MQWQMSLSIMHNDARDTVWKLEGSKLYSLGTGGEHVNGGEIFQITRQTDH